MAAHSSILAWGIPWTEEPGGLLSMGSHGVGHDWSDLAAANAIILGHEIDTMQVKQLEERPSVYDIAAAKSLQSCLTLCDLIDSSPPGCPVPGILQARTLEWVAISFSNALKWKVKVKSLSRVRLFATPWTAANKAPPSMGFSRQEYWSGVPLPSLVYDIGKHNISIVLPFGTLGEGH